MLKKIKGYLGVKPHQNILPDQEHVTYNNKAEKKCHTKMDIPGSVPIEVFYEILLYLSSRDLHNAWKCCRKWRNHMEFFWKRKCILDGYFECEEDLNSKLYRKFVDKYSRWQVIYMYNSQLESNWIKQNCKEMKINYQLDHFVPCKELSYFSGDVFIITSNRENTILVIDFSTGFKTKKFIAYRIFANSSLVIRKIGKVENWLIVVSEVRSLNRISYAGRIHIKVWDIETGRSLTEFKVEMQIAVQVMIYKDLDKIAMGSDVGTIVIMNLYYTELMEINCFNSICRIDDIQIKGKYMIALSQNENADDFRACIWNLETKQKLYEVKNLLKNELRIYLNQNRLVYLCEDRKYGNTMKYCRLDSGDCIFTFDEEFVISTSHDFFILHKSTIYESFKIRSIKTDTVAPVQLGRAWNSSSFWITKSKLAYIISSNSYFGCLTTVVNFEDTIKI